MEPGTLDPFKLILELVLQGGFSNLDELAERAAQVSPAPSEDFQPPSLLEPPSPLPADLVSQLAAGSQQQVRTPDIVQQQQPLLNGATQFTIPIRPEANTGIEQIIGNSTPDSISALLPNMASVLKLPVPQNGSRTQQDSLQSSIPDLNAIIGGL